MPSLGISIYMYFSMGIICILFITWLDTLYVNVSHLKGRSTQTNFCNTWSPTRLPTQSCAVLPQKLVFLIRRSSSWQACSSNIVRRRNVEVVSFWLCYFVFPTFVISCRYYRPYNLEIHHISSCYRSYQDSGHFPSTSLFSALYIQVDVTSLRVFTTTNSLLFHRLPETGT